MTLSTPRTVRLELKKVSKHDIGELDSDPVRLALLTRKLRSDTLNFFKYLGRWPESP